MKWKLAVQIIHPRGHEEEPYEMYDSEAAARGRMYSCIDNGVIDFYVADEPYKSERMPVKYYIPMHRVVAWKIYEVEE